MTPEIKKKKNWKSLLLHIGAMSEETGTRVKREKTTEMFCHTIAKGISEIVRFSINENFRKKSFTILRVSSTSEMEKKIYEKLLASIVKSTSINQLSSSDEETDAEESSKTTSKPTHGERGQNPAIMYSKNWLEISIQKNEKDTTRGNHFKKFQDSKHHELFPNHSEDYAPYTQNWDISRCSQ